MLQFGPYISDKEKEKLKPAIQKMMDSLPDKIIGNIHIKDEFLCLKAFEEEMSFEYGNERECILELQSSESVPLLVAYNDEDLILVLDLVHGQNLLNYCKEHGIPLAEFEDDLLSALQCMLKKGWYLRSLELTDIVWCEECNALFIVDFSGCERVHGKPYEEYSNMLREKISTLFQSNETCHKLGGC